MEQEPASSPVIGGILVVVITIILALLVLIMSAQWPHLWVDPVVPAIFKITQIGHRNSAGIVDDESYLVLINSKDVAYRNDKLYAKIIRNGKPFRCVIPTLNGNDFIQVHSCEIQYMGGPGSDDHSWNSNAMLYFNCADGKIRLGDTVQFEVYDKTTNQIISRDTWPHTDTHDAQWFYRYFLNHQAV